MPLPPKLEEEFLNWLETKGRENERLLKILKKYQREAMLQFWMQKRGYTNRAYALKRLKAS